MQRGLWTRKDLLWHEMSGDVKVRRLLGTFYIRLHRPFRWTGQWGLFFLHVDRKPYRVSE